MSYPWPETHHHFAIPQTLNGLTCMYSVYKRVVTCLCTHVCLRVMSEGETAETGGTIGTKTERGMHTCSCTCTRTCMCTWCIHT